MGSCGRLIGDGPVAQGHAHNGRHVSLGAKHVDGDPGGLPCGGGKSPSSKCSDQRLSPRDSAQVLYSPA